ncbi:MAG TPA: type IV pilus modification protein PilV [Dehalococcoidia bacterium]|nr:MAG: type IV pilus modification protein PilV [Deltaproteobacteria bacterium RBG_13_52_11]HJX04050.1 type IV pilus modification protein PilV [Dehalococcoidia bacterium]
MQDLFLKKNAGFTLIEVMIALVILAVGLLALATMQIVSVRSNAFSTEMTYATMLAQSRLEQIRNTSYDNVTPGTVNENVSASASTKGMAYIVQRIVADNTPAADMKTVTLTINWTGSPAGSATGETTVLFTTSFDTVIKRY